MATERDNAIASLREAGRAEMEAVATIARLTEQRDSAHAVIASSRKILAEVKAPHSPGLINVLRHAIDAARTTLGAAPGETVQDAAKRVANVLVAAQPWLEDIGGDDEPQSARDLLELVQRLGGGK